MDVIGTVCVVFESICEERNESQVRNGCFVFNAQKISRYLDERMGLENIQEWQEARYEFDTDGAVLLFLGLY